MTPLRCAGCRSRPPVARAVRVGEVLLETTAMFLARQGGRAAFFEESGVLAVQPVDLNTCFGDADGAASRPGSTSPTPCGRRARGAAHESHRVPRQIVINDMARLLKVDTLGENIGSDDDVVAVLTAGQGKSPVRRDDGGTSLGSESASVFARQLDSWAGTGAAARPSSLLCARGRVSTIQRLARTRDAARLGN